MDEKDVLALHQRFREKRDELLDQLASAEIKESRLFLEGQLSVLKTVLADLEALLPEVAFPGKKEYSIIDNYQFTDCEERIKMPTVSFNVRRVRESRKLSQLRLAKESGVSQGLISYIEHATVSPSSKVLMKLAATLGVDVGEFFKPIPQRG